MGAATHVIQCFSLNRISLAIACCLYDLWSRGNHSVTSSQPGKSKQNAVHVSIWYYWFKVHPCNCEEVGSDRCQPLGGLTCPSTTWVSEPEQLGILGALWQSATWRHSSVAGANSNNLSVLDLSDNQMKWSIPPHLCKYQKLIFQSVSLNRLAGNMNSLREWRTAELWLSDFCWELLVLPLLV
jgi:hypothetical protein